MGLRSWIKRHTGHGDAPQAPAAQATRPAAGGTEPARAQADAPPLDGMWEPLPAYLPVDAGEHMHACVIASAIAACDRPNSELKVRRVLIANPEHRTVAVIASALAAGAMPESSCTVKNIYKMKEEGSHAA